MPEWRNKIGLLLFYYWYTKTCTLDWFSEIWRELLYIHIFNTLIDRENDSRMCLLLFWWKKWSGSPFMAIFWQNSSRTALYSWWKLSSAPKKIILDIFLAKKITLNTISIYKRYVAIKKEYMIWYFYHCFPCWYGSIYVQCFCVVNLFVYLQKIPTYLCHLRFKQN